MTSEDTLPTMHRCGPFVDLHSHVLPEVDDGAVSLEETLAMLRLAYAGGTRRLVATPHLFLAAFRHLRAATLCDRFDVLQGELHEARAAAEGGLVDDLQLQLAAEHHMAPELFAALKANAVLPLGQSRRLLVELPLYLAPEGVEAGLEKVLEEGYQPLLAHVERYSLVLTPRRRLRRLLDMGCLLQINAESLLTSHRPLRRLCVELLRRGWVHAVASDAHHVDRRPPSLGPAADWLAAHFSPKAARFWLHHGPSAILDGEDIPIPPRRFRDWFESF